MRGARCGRRRGVVAHVVHEVARVRVGRAAAARAAALSAAAVGAACRRRRAPHRCPREERATVPRDLGVAQLRTVRAGA